MFILLDIELCAFHNCLHSVWSVTAVVVALWATPLPGVTGGSSFGACCQIDGQTMHTFYIKNLWNGKPDTSNDQVKITLTGTTSSVHITQITSNNHQRQCHGCMHHWWEERRQNLSFLSFVKRLDNALLSSIEWKYRYSRKKPSENPCGMQFFLRYSWM